MFKKSTAAQRLAKLALGASVALLGAASAPSFAATTATASATATVVTPIAIAKATDLVFGKFIAGPGGSVTVSTSGARTSTGVTEVSGVTPVAATFNVTGDGTSTYAIDTTGTSANLTSGANNMAFAIVSDLTGGNTTSGTVSTGALTAGAQTIYVGGVLTVGAAQAPGAYSGTISVAVNYN